MIKKTDDEETDNKDDDENDEVDKGDKTGDESGEWIIYKNKDLSFFDLPTGVSIYKQTSNICRKLQ